MELRNRETHLRGKLTNIAFNINESEKEIDLTILLDNSDGECIDRQFYSLAELKSFLREWEEYEPEEPLIKDEKIRKAVRAWAEANGVEQVTVEKDFSSYTFFATDTGKVDITVWTEPSLSNLSKDKTYTIIELCGKEEE